MDIEALLRALGEPARLKILNLLLSRPYCVRALSRTLGVTEPAVSQHLKVMREAGLVSGERYGRHVHYAPRAEALDALVAAFEEMRIKARERDNDRGECRCEFRKKGADK